MSRGNKVGLRARVVDAGKALGNFFFKLYGRIVKTGKAERARAANAGRSNSDEGFVDEASIKERGAVSVSSVVEEDLEPKVSAEELAAKRAEAMQGSREAKAQGLKEVASGARSAAKEAEEAAELLEAGSDLKEQARVLAEDLDKVAEEVRLGDRTSGAKESLVAREKTAEVKDIASQARVEASEVEGEDIDAELREWKEADDAEREVRREADAARVAAAGEVVIPKVEVKEGEVVIRLNKLEDFSAIRAGLEKLAKQKGKGKRILVDNKLFVGSGLKDEDMKAWSDMQLLLGKLRGKGYMIEYLMGDEE